MWRIHSSSSHVQHAVLHVSTTRILTEPLLFLYVCFSIFADCLDSALHDSGQWRTRRRWSGRRGGGWRAQAPVLTKMMTSAPLPLLQTHLPARAPLGQTPQVKCPKAPTGCSHSLVKQICHVGLIRCLNIILFVDFVCVTVLFFWFLKAFLVVSN